MKTKNIILIVVTILLAGGIFYFSVLHLEVEYTSFKVCYVSSEGLEELYFLDAPIYPKCIEECKYPNLLNGGVGVNSKGYYCPYKNKKKKKYKKSKWKNT